MLTLFNNPFNSKVTRIESILKRFRERRFVLVGDSGEKDPEVYGELARRHRAQIVAILIRNVTATDDDDERWKKAFRNVDGTRWQVFRHPDDIQLPIDVFEQ